jgi:hypothetical protein
MRKGAVSLLIVFPMVLVAGFFVAHMFQSTQAASLSNVKDTLSSPAPGATSTHTITFVSPSGVSSTQDATITVEFDTSGTSFSLPDGISHADVDLSVGDSSNCDTASYTDYNLAAATSTGTWGASFSTSTDILTLTYPANATTTVASSTCVKIEVGGNVAHQGTSTVNITNPSKSASVGTADVYTIRIGGTFADSGNALVAVIEGVTVSATVAETLTFTISSVTSGNCVEGSGGDGFTATSTTSSSVPFGQLSAGAFVQGCHDALVTTNAANGFNLTTRSNNSLNNGSGGVIPDTPCDSSCTTTVAGTWVTASNPGFGYSCDPGGSSDACNSTFSTSTVFRPFSSSTAISVASSSEASSAGGNTQRILYRMAIDATQAAGSYSNTITWVATPSF